MYIDDKNDNSTTHGVNVLSLFDGMACGMLAFLGLNIRVENYYAYEIDKYAIQTTQHNFPNIAHLGDVFDADFSKHKDIDYLIGGSPCTYWSIAQANDRRETTASGLGWELFSQFVRALKESKPKYFLYENNKSMSKAIYESISDTFGFEPIMINAAKVSAQNRNRYYWCGVRNENGTYDKIDIPQPEDRGILLKDILQGMTDRDKSRAVISSVGRTTTREYFKKHQNTMTFEPVGTTKDGKAFCVTSGYSKGSGEKIGNYAAHTLSKGCKSMVAEPIGTTADGKAFCFLANYHKVSGNNPNRTFEKHKDSMAAELISNKSEVGFAQICEYDDSGNPYKAISCTDGKKYLVYKVANNQITIKDKVYPISIKDGYYIIRKLTVLECMRLQTIPEWYDFSVVSDTQAYKMLGNGWCVEVIKHLLSYYK